MNAGRTRVWLAEAGAGLALAVLIAGCGNNFQPVVRPTPTNGPPAQPQSFAVVVSSTGPATPGVATIIDYSGDSVMAEAPIGPGPVAFMLAENGDTGYSLNSDGTITNIPITTSLQEKLELTTTLPAGAAPLNLFGTSGMFATDLNGNVADVFNGSPQTFDMAIPVAPTPVTMAGASIATAQRDYVISQNFTDPTGLTCNADPAPSTLPDGVVTPIELSTDTADAPIPVGKCPVYAVESADGNRLFVLNRGDDTITVINSQTNALDNDCPAPTGCVNQNGQTYFSHPTLPLSLSAVNATGIMPPNGDAGMPQIAGPVDAEYNAATQQLVVADYDGGTISVIDVSLDQYGNDSPTFGTTYTIPVGNDPASVTVLYDGSKAYTANQADGTVTVVDLSSYTVEKTLAVVGNPRTVVSTQNSGYSKVYVGSPNSPYITIIESTPTVTDVIDTTVLVEGNVVDVRTTTQNGATSGGNDNFSSRVPGYGQPCNLPPALMTQTYGANYTLANCQTSPQTSP